MFKATLYACRKLVDPDNPQRASKGVTSAATWKPDLDSDLATLGLPCDIKLESTLNEYVEQVSTARRVLKSAGLN